MIRPIKLTEALVNECVEEFRKSISASRMYSGALKYEKTFRWQGQVPPAKIVFSVPAYMKMCTLIDNFSSEIAWHCTVRRDENAKEVFYVLDVFVSPQKVTGTTVNSDQAEYEQWLCTLDDEVFNNLKMQCHSHVNMSVSPSNVDKQHWSGVLNALVEDGDVFYIFMIWNKQMKYTAQVYDLTNNTYYDDKDVVVETESFGVNLADFLQGAKDIVKVTTYGSGYGGPITPYTGPARPSNPPAGGYTNPTTSPTGTTTGQDPAKTAGEKAKDAWNQAESEREKELEKRKNEKGGGNIRDFDSRYGVDRKDPPRYGGSYGSYGHGYDHYNGYYGDLYD